MTITIPPMSPFPGRGAAPEDYIAQADTTMQELPRTIAKMNEMSAAFNVIAGVGNLGYLPPVPYAAGITLTQVTQTVQYGPTTFAPLLGSLPFVTTGVFADEVSKFRVIQGVLRSELTAPTGADGVGVQQIGDGAVPRTMAEKSSDALTPRDYGGVVDGIADDSAAVARVAAIGAELSMPIVVPKRARNSMPLAGVERYKTIWSEPAETDYIGAHAADAYAGLRVDIDTYGDSTDFGTNPHDLSSQVPEPSSARLQTVLRRFYGNNSIYVRNMGIPGTTVRQMLAGTDGSGLTFEARIAASPAKIVYVNHCINSCQLMESADGYKRDMDQVAQIIRKYGKSPIFRTPNPMLPTIIGDRRKAAQIAAYAEVMRQVCREIGVPLVDNFAWVTAMLASGKYSVLDLLPDGCHPSPFLYSVMGQNMAAPLICPGGGFTGPDQFLAGMSAQVLGSSASPSVSPNSRLGGGVISGVGGSQSVRMAFIVESAGLDVYVAIPIWPSGAAAAQIVVDRVQLGGSFSFNDPSGRPGGRFVQDHEIRVIENAQPGLHFVEFECSAGGGVGAYYVRTRKTRQETAQLYGAIANYRQPLLTNFEMYSTSSNALILMDSIPTPRWDRDFRIEVTAVWQAGVGVALGGTRIGDNGATPTQIEAGFIVGIDANGFASIWENIGGTYTKIFTGTVDYRGQRHTFYIRATGGRFGTIQMYRTSELLGTATLTRPYWGGVLGVWKESSGGSWLVERVDYLNDATV